MAKGWRVFVYICMPPLALLFLALPFLLMQGKNLSLATGAGFGLLGVGLAGLVVYGLLDTLKNCFIIGLREVSQVGVFNTKTLTLQEIDGYRIGDKYTFIYPKEIYLPTLKIAYTTERYHEITQWLAARYPDFDKVATEKATATLLADTALGDTPEARVTALAKAQRTARLLNIAGWAGAGWLFFYPHPYKWAIATGVFLPLLATLALRLHKHTLGFFEDKTSAYPSVATAVFMPSLSLVIRSLFDFEAVDYASLWLPAGLAGLGMAVLLVLGARTWFFRDNELFIKSLVVIPAAIMYGYGATSTINAVYDESPATIYRPQVVSKHINSGKSTTYYLKLPAWGPVATEEDVKVSRTYYQQVQPGQQVAVALRPGRLGVPWFAVLE